jgi:hypothetical protein
VIKIQPKGWFEQRADIEQGLSQEECRQIVALAVEDSDKDYRRANSVQFEKEVRCGRTEVVIEHPQQNKRCSVER